MILIIKNKREAILCSDKNRMKLMSCIPTLEKTGNQFNLSAYNQKPRS